MSGLPNRARSTSIFRIATLPGVFVAVVVAIAATILAPYAPILGSPVIAIVLGVMLRSCVALPASLEPGIRYTARTVLQVAIVVSGLGISLTSIYRTGLGTLPVTLGTIALVLVAAPILGRLLQLDAKLRELVGIGTAICGASAIAAVATVIEPTETQISLAVATIFTYNIAAVLTFPLVGHALGLSQAQFGVWAGTAINDTSSVVAAGFAYGPEAGAHATIVKLTRATLILPIVGVMAVLRARAEQHAGKAIPWLKIVPWFVLWFLVAAIVNSLGAVPVAWHAAIANLSTFLISVALAAIGMQTALAALLHAGSRPLTLGFALWMLVALSSLGIQHFAHL
jgi:uncharacterized integral membrane protein (TIGR00698 family)